MKKSLFVLSCLCLTTSFAQLSMDKLNIKKGKSSKETAEGTSGLPKGIQVYDQTHTDETGMSGKYFLLYPIYLEGNGKGFELDQVTLEYRKDSYNGVLHWVNDEQGKGLRYPDLDMNKLADFSPAANGSIGIKVIEKFNNYAFAVNNNNQFKPAKQPQSFKDKANIVRYNEDPDILIVTSARIFESQGCTPVYKAGDTYEAIKLDTRYSFGQQFNVMVKDPSKLKDWDSTRLMQVALEAKMKVCSDNQAAMADVFELPKKQHKDPALEKELSATVKGMAAKDRPIAWDDKFDYLYMHTDWHVVYADKQKTIPLYRSCVAIATSCGWDLGECRYISVHVKQDWNGTDYGPKQVGFGGSLIPVSREKVNAIKK